MCRRFKDMSMLHAHSCDFIKQCRSTCYRAMIWMIPFLVIWWIYVRGSESELIIQIWYAEVFDQCTMMPSLCVKLNVQLIIYVWKWYGISGKTVFRIGVVDLAARVWWIVECIVKTWYVVSMSRFQISHAEGIRTLGSRHAKSTGNRTICILRICTSREPESKI